MRIRHAVPADAESIASILARAFAALEPLYTPEGFRATTPDADAVRRRMEEGPVWVAMTRGACIGTVAAMRRGNALYVRGMAVLPEARGRGVANRLMAVVERYALDERFTHVTLCTTPFLIDAIRLYERRGFVRVDDGPHDLFGTPLFTMVKSLTGKLSACPPVSFRSSFRHSTPRH